MSDEQNKISMDETAATSVTQLLSNSGFNKLNDNLKVKALESVTEQRSKDNDKKYGFFSKIFGSDSKNISLYIAFIICFILILVGLIYIFISNDYKKNTNVEFWNIIAPILSATLGFIFGKKND